ncbi:MAG: VOC family protein [Dehalococcoidales bacterium]|nr:MAG: VOC family protein [Dehalococcoidales bacterium]
MKNDWEFDHVGLVVSDLDEILYYYSSLGIGVDIGTLGPNATNPVPGAPEEEPLPRTMTVYGKPRDSRRTPETGKRVNINRIFGNIQMGSLVIECILGRPNGDGFNDDYFRECGEGISHICYNIPDPEKETSMLVEKGTDVIMSLEQEGKIVENYLETSKYGKIWLSFRPPAGDHHKAWQAHNRAHPLVSDWKFLGMGVATKDLDNAVEYYRSLEIAEVYPESILDNNSSPDSGVKAKTRKVTVGEIGYEFAQPLESSTNYGECLTGRGEGVYSLDFTVDDLEKETSRLKYRGVDVVLNGKLEDGSTYAYFDTRKVGNLMIKLVQAGR